MLGVSGTLSASAWSASLNIVLQRRGLRTVLAHCAHHGPLRVQRPFYPEGERLCHVAVLHPPGGVVGGDELTVEVMLESNAHGLITTPAAGKFYRSTGRLARQMQHLTVAADAALEWLPQESIVYDGARVHTQTRVDLQGNARFIGWEITCLGRPAAGERFATGEYRQNFTVWRDGEPLYLEQGRYIGGDPLLGAAWGLQNQPVLAALLCAGSPPGAVDAIRARWQSWQLPLAMDKGLATVSQLDGILICRYLGASTAHAWRFFIMAWHLLRPLVLKQPPCSSRFWVT